MPIKFIIRWL